MRRVLIVSPHFPPVDAVDMHRVRMTVGHYRAQGWEPVVLCVRPRDAGRLSDPALLETVPSDVEVVTVPAMRPLPGLSALSLRGWLDMKKAGDRLLAQGKFDLVFISTTQFPMMALGRAWKARFGTPFVLDFQDPWATFPASAAAFIRQAVKHRVMRGLHRRLERWTLPAADGLLAVSADYIELLRAAYPTLRSRPALVSPFGFAAADFAVAERVGRPLPLPAPPPGSLTCLYAGAVAPAMESSLSALFRGVAAGRRRRPALYDRLRFQFVGTGYDPAGGPRIADRLAAQSGVGDLVCEHPGRVPMLDTLAALAKADCLMILGSEDDGYSPSKMRQYLSLPKPILAAAPAQSKVTQAIAQLETVLFTPADPGVEADWDARLERMLAAPAAVDYAERLAQTGPFEALACAARDCGLFDQVMAAAADGEVR